MTAEYATKGSKNNNQLGAAAMERERELRILAELRGGDEESKILGQPGRGRGEFGERGDGLHEDGGSEAKTGRRAGEHGGDGRARMINSTVNYVLNACNRFRGCGGGEDGRAGRIRMSAPDLRLEIRRPNWVRMRLALAATTPAHQSINQILGGDVGKGLVLPGMEGKGAATMCFHRRHRGAHVTLNTLRF